MAEKYGRSEWQTCVVKYVWRLKDSRRVLTIICGVISRRENVETTCVHYLAYANKVHIGEVRSLCSNRECREKTCLSAAGFWSAVRALFRIPNIDEEIFCTRLRNRRNIRHTGENWKYPWLQPGKKRITWKIHWRDRLNPCDVIITENYTYSSKKKNKE